MISVLDSFDTAIVRKVAMTECDQRLFRFISDSIIPYYPNGAEWLSTKVFSDDPSRLLLISQLPDGLVNGFSILKNDDFEKKICTLFVSPDFRGKGIGTALLDCSLDLLECNKPLITVSDELLLSFIPLFSRFGFENTTSYVDKYREGHTEYSFNGVLK